MTPLRTFLVESYAPASSDFGPLAAQAQQAAASSPASDLVRYVRSILVPEDEICFHLFEAASASSVEAAIGTVPIRAQRIVEARS
jgi:hypothetical protein